MSLRIFDRNTGIFCVFDFSAVQQNQIENNATSIVFRIPVIVQFVTDIPEKKKEKTGRFSTRVINSFTSAVNHNCTYEDNPSKPEQCS